MQREIYEPKIVGFFCNWCSYRAADGAGTARIKHSPNVRVVRLMCSGRVDPSFVLKALSLGADGVLIAGCHPGECHYLEQNYKTMRRFAMLQHTLRALGNKRTARPPGVGGRLRKPPSSPSQSTRWSRTFGPSAHCTGPRTGPRRTSTWTTSRRDPA